MGADTGRVGLSINIPNLPYCICVSQKPDKGTHIVSDPKNLVNLFESESIPFLIASSAISLLSCHNLPEDASPEKRQRRFCSGEEILPILRDWIDLLLPGGVMITALIDENYAREGGWSLFQKTPDICHVWTASRFEEYIIKPLLSVVEIEEFNNFHNHFAFNLVLRRI